ncbi:MAG: hypothetical protein ACI82A_003639 [Candidatus Azotimanducaceae bacterium]|jgi:hypothetical protein
MLPSDMCRVRVQFFRCFGFDWFILRYKLLVGKSFAGNVAVLFDRGFNVTPQIISDIESDAECDARIVRILQLQLTSVEARLSSLKIFLGEDESNATQQVRYRCEIKAALKSGQKLQLVMFNTGLHICVADAAARLVREIRRSRQGQLSRTR